MPGPREVLRSGDTEPPSNLQEIANETIPVLLQYRRDDAWRAAYARLFLATESYTVRVLTKVYGPRAIDKHFEDFRQGFGLELIEKKIQDYRKSEGKYGSWVAQCAKNYFSDKFIRPLKGADDQRGEAGQKQPKSQRRGRAREYSIDQGTDERGNPIQAASNVAAEPDRVIDDHMARRLFEALRDVGEISLEHRVIFMLLENLPLSESDELVTFERLCQRKYLDIRMDLKWNPPTPKLLSSLTGVKPNTLAVIRKRVAEHLRNAFGEGSRSESSDNLVST